MTTDHVESTQDRQEALIKQGSKRAYTYMTQEIELIVSAVWDNIAFREPMND